MQCRVMQSIEKHHTLIPSAIFLWWQELVREKLLALSLTQQNFRTRADPVLTTASLSKRKSELSAGAARGILHRILANPITTGFPRSWQPAFGPYRLDPAE